MYPALPHPTALRRALEAVLQLEHRILVRLSSDESVPDFAREEIEEELAATDRELRALEEAAETAPAT